MLTRHKEVTIDQLRIKLRNQHRVLAAQNKALDNANQLTTRAAIKSHILAGEDRMRGTKDKIATAEKEIKELYRSYNRKPYLKGRK
jgi:hypothetical protein